MDEKPPTRIVLAKIGLDGHDRGIKVVARGLRDAGCHVIYSGLWQSPSAVARAVVDEDADWLGLSVLNGAHMTQVPRVLEALKQRGLADVGVLVGGIIPEGDQEKLLELGVQCVFGPGTAIDEIINFLRQISPAGRDRTSATMLDELLVRFHNRDPRALARLITLAARGEHLAAIRRAVSHSTGSSAVIAFTGGAGVGKSSLIGRLIRHLRTQDRTIAVLACDPQSPLTGGALLGDRIRMSDSADDKDVYIRSLSAVSGNQSIAENFDLIVDLTKAFGFQIVLLETVGAGQSDTAIRDLADVVVLLVQPETGDELQWQKAGVLEIADVVVVQKSDLPGADRLEAELNEQLNLPGCRAVPVLSTSASRNQGLDVLWQLIESSARNGKSLLR